ncbi:hypothetical protein A6E05_19290 [Aliivibrio sp. 1S165]|uniref:hypothetical protein n=1 Tax=unclassified Aliivibrio TaxID=2645654 RepID=UPI00080E9FBF|nr:MULTISPECIES: hypothetical protein [unclassified Aliivibrio]OCH14052.1 hypothetical protein A6E05_19290 [Aliivibrio sp. 1S165]OCH31346.1 hypothetical protein A6E06_19115 [Aliivibrio sp. 1S175]
MAYTVVLTKKVNDIVLKKSISVGFSYSTLVFGIGSTLFKRDIKGTFVYLFLAMILLISRLFLGMQDWLLDSNSVGFFIGAALPSMIFDAINPFLSSTIAFFGAYNSLAVDEDYTYLGIYYFLACIAGYFVASKTSLWHLKKWLSKGWILDLDNQQSHLTKLQLADIKHILAENDIHLVQYN